MLVVTALIIRTASQGSGVIETGGDGFGSWVEVVEPRLRRAFAGVRGPDRAHDATAEALAYAWEHWERVRQMENGVGYVFRVGVSRTRRRRELHALRQRLEVPTDV